MPTDRLRRATLVAALLAATVLGVAALDSGHGTDDRSAAVSRVEGRDSENRRREEGRDERRPAEAVGRHLSTTR